MPNLEELAKLMVPMSDERVRAVLQELQSADVPEGFVPVECEGHDEFWSTAKERT